MAVGKNISDPRNQTLSSYGGKKLLNTLRKNRKKKPRSFASKWLKQYK